MIGSMQNITSRGHIVIAIVEPLVLKNTNKVGKRNCPIVETMNIITLDLLCS